MARNSLDKLHIELYSVDGIFQGYLKSISTYYNKVESTNNIAEAKPYAKQETAAKDCNLVGILTRGGLRTNIS